MTSSNTTALFPADDHDHADCVRQAMAQAEGYCGRSGLRLTELRHRVLELIWANHQPVGAYHLLEQLNNDGRKAAPPTVYRSLDFLLEHGLIHRISSLNAFVGCSHPGHPHAGQFLICTDCGKVNEISEEVLGSGLRQVARTAGFHTRKPVVELLGTCAHCGRRDH